MASQFKMNILPFESAVPAALVPAAAVPASPVVLRIRFGAAPGGGTTLGCPERGSTQVVVRVL